MASSPIALSTVAPARKKREVSCSIVGGVSGKAGPKRPQKKAAAGKKGTGVAEEIPHAPNPAEEIPQIRAVAHSCDICGVTPSGNVPWAEYQGQTPVGPFCLEHGQQLAPLHFLSPDAIVQKMRSDAAFKQELLDALARDGLTPKPFFAEQYRDQRLDGIAIQHIWDIYNKSEFKQRFLKKTTPTNTRNVRQMQVPLPQSKSARERGDLQEEQEETIYLFPPEDGPPRRLIQFTNLQGTQDKFLMTGDMQLIAAQGDMCRVQNTNARLEKQGALDLTTNSTLIGQMNAAEFAAHLGGKPAAAVPAARPLARPEDVFLPSPVPAPPQIVSRVAGPTSTPRSMPLKPSPSPTRSVRGPSLPAVPVVAPEENVPQTSIEASDSVSAIGALPEEGALASIDKASLNPAAVPLLSYKWFLNLALEKGMDSQLREKGVQQKFANNWIVDNAEDEGLKETVKFLKGWLETFRVAESLAQANIVAFREAGALKQALRCMLDAGAKIPAHAWARYCDLCSMAELAQVADAARCPDVFVKVEAWKEEPEDVDIEFDPEEFLAKPAVSDLPCDIPTKRQLFLKCFAKGFFAKHVASDPQGEKKALVLAFSRHALDRLDFFLAELDLGSDCLKALQECCQVSRTFVAMLDPWEALVGGDEYNTDALFIAKCPVGPTVFGVIVGCVKDSPFYAARLQEVMDTHAMTVKHKAEFNEEAASLEEKAFSQLAPADAALILQKVLGKAASYEGCLRKGVVDVFKARLYQAMEAHTLTVFKQSLPVRPLADPQYTSLADLKTLAEILQKGSLVFSSADAAGAALNDKVELVGEALSLVTADGKRDLVLQLCAEFKQGESLPEETAEIYSRGEAIIGESAGVKWTAGQVEQIKEVAGAILVSTLAVLPSRCPKALHFAEKLYEVVKCGKPVSKTIASTREAYALIGAEFSLRTDTDAAGKVKAFHLEAFHAHVNKFSQVDLTVFAKGQGAMAEFKASCEAILCKHADVLKGDASHKLGCLVEEGAKVSGGIGEGKLWNAELPEKSAFPAALELAKETLLKSTYVDPLLKELSGKIHEASKEYTDICKEYALDIDEDLVGRADCVAKAMRATFVEALLYLAFSQFKEDTKEEQQNLRESVRGAMSEAKALKVPETALAKTLYEKVNQAKRLKYKP